SRLAISDLLKHLAASKRSIMYFICLADEQADPRIVCNVATNLRAKRDVRGVDAFKSKSSDAISRIPTCRPGYGTRHGLCNSTFSPRPRYSTSRRRSQAR